MGWQTSLRFGVVGLLGVIVLASAQAQDWPQFRGPDGQGISTANHVPVTWNATTNVTWRRELPGNGWSSPVLVGGRIYLTTAVPNGEPTIKVEGESKKSDRPFSLRALCLDAVTGDVVWDREVAVLPAGTSIHPKNSHASATPVVDETGIYVHFGPYATALLSFDGTMQWKTAIDYPPMHGGGGSPVRFEDLLIFNCDGATSPFVIGLDAKTGQERWRTARPAVKSPTFSFSTPLVISWQGQDQLISAGSSIVCGYDPRNGKELWSVRFTNKWSIVPRPVFANGLLLICTGYEGPAELLAIRAGGEGDVTDTHIAWRADRFIPHNPSPLVHDDTIYLVSDSGIASCRDLQTGDLIWQHRVSGNFSASPILANNHIYLMSEEGLCTVIRPTRTYEEVAANDLAEQSLASITPLDRGLLIRTAAALYRIGESTPSTK